MDFRVVAQCEAIRVGIDRAEADPPILLDRRARDAALAERNQRRARLEAVIAELQGSKLVEEVLRRADKKWPLWRT